jgi:hypothetical protein
MATTEHYLGNPNLKRANATVEYSAEQIKEYIKCSKDPVYFMKMYIQIVNIDRGLIPFQLYDFQESIVDKVVNNRFVICKMPRQSGKTTTIAATILWYVLFNESYNVAILANKLQQAREILSRIQLAYEHLPKWLQQGVLEWNKGNIELENGSKILASATSSSAIRGGSFNLIYLDEFAFVPTNLQEEFFASVYPTISSGTTSKVLITSTPNGLNMFYKIWVDSEEGRNSYKRVDVHWSDVPGRDDKWKEETIRNTSEDQFRVEFECDFVGSSNTLIHPSKLKFLVHRSPIESTESLKVYAKPEPGKPYVVVVDTSRGTGQDYSAYIVVDVSEVPYKIVATYRNNVITPILYPNAIHPIAEKYNNAMILVETNDIGAQIADILHHDLEYEGVLVCSSNGRSGQTLGGGFGGKSSHFGVRTTKSVKRLGCANLKAMVEGDKLIIPDFETIHELSTFISKGTSYEAEDGKHDDMVMCCVLFSWLVSQDYFKELTEIDIRTTLYKENAKAIEDSVLPFGILDDGQPYYEPDDALYNDELNY